MSRHIGAKPQKEPATIPAPATGGLLKAEPHPIGEPETFEAVEPEPAEPEPVEAPKKVTKRPKKTAKK